MSKQVVYVVKVVDSATGKLVKVGTELDKTDKKAKKATRSLKEMDKSLAKMLKGGMIAASVMIIGRAFADQAKKIIEANGQMERYNATLETMLGSKSAARERMEEYMRIAKTTPFELTEVVEAGNKLQALGRYSEDTLVMLGDLAAASGKPLEQAMNAYSKMASDQKGIAVDMFRDLLITTDDWAKATGKGVKASGEMVASADEMLKVLPEILKSKGFFGLMAKQSETTEGKIANFQDAVFSLRASIGEKLAPTTKSIVGVMSKWVSSMDEAVKIPIEQKIAKEKVELNYLVENLIKANDNEEERTKWIADLQSKYPDFLKNVNLEKDGAKGLREELEKVNAEYDKKIKLAVYSKKLEKIQEEAEDLGADIADVQLAQNAMKEIDRIQKEINALTGGHWSTIGKNDRYGYYKWQGNTQLYFNKAKQDRLDVLYAELAAQRAFKEQGENWLGVLGDSEADQKKMKSLYAQADVIQKEIDKLNTPTNPEVVVEENKAGGGGGNAGDGGNAGTGGGGKDTGTTLGSGGGSGRGGGAVVNIANLVGKIELHTVNMKEGVAEIKRIVTQALVEATAEI